MRGYLISAVFLTSAFLAAAILPAAAADDLARLKTEASHVTITRDDWGIAHVKGHSDADAVFGMVYAQAEDDFNRVETNFAVNLGRMAEADGESALWTDLRQRLFIDPVVLKGDYAKSPAWLKALMDSWADGLNYYLATHPNVHPRVITHFEPWMALSFTEGSIGGDIEKAAPRGIEAFYGKDRQAFNVTPDLHFREPTGSNGIVIDPKLTRNGHALLLINPHTSFYFRSELQMASDDGLNAYGAATWGQFFLYQGFNQHIGWMHTTSTADAIDEFAETVTQRGGKYFYKYGDRERPVTTKTIVLNYMSKDGGMAARKFTAYFTHHGPIVREADGKWIALSIMNKPVEALEQSYLRTKQSDYASYLKVAQLQADSSNNTLFADDSGEIAYLHPQFVPKRDNRFDYMKPVDGSDPATDWQGLTPINDMPHLLSPPTGWIFNTNDGPWNAAGPDSPKRADYPRYMDMLGENPRGEHATLLLTGAKDMTMESLTAKAFDSYLPEFAKLIPRLAAAYDAAPDPKLKDQMALLKGWDDRWSDHSLATSLAVFWGEDLWNDTLPEARAAGVTPYVYIETRATGAEQLKALQEASDKLTADFGNWRTPWGEINRFQRLDDAIQPHFDDAQPSIPVPFASSQWGSLASFGAKRYPNTRRYYGTSGNSFVAVVEFGPKVKAVAVMAGGESGDPKSPHFQDGALRYAWENLRPVYFYPEDLIGHTEKVYQPGD